MECRADELELAVLLGALTCPAGLAAVTAERSLLQALGAGCTASVGAYAAGTRPLRMRAAVVGADGRQVLRAHAAAPLDSSASLTEALRLGRGLAAELLCAGARDLMEVTASGL